MKCWDFAFLTIRCGESKIRQLLQSSAQSSADPTDTLSLTVKRESEMAGKFEINKAKDGQFYFNLKASNGRVILTSERYKELRGAENGIASVQKNAGTASRYEERTSSKGGPYFVLKAANGEPIGTSETYSSASAARKGIASVQRHAPGAAVKKPV